MILFAKQRHSQGYSEQTVVARGWGGEGWVERTVMTYTCYYIKQITNEDLLWAEAHLGAGNEPSCQWRRHGFNSWVRKLLWRRAWQPTPVFLSGESLGQRSLMGYNPRGRKESDTTEERAHSGKDLPYNAETLLNALQWPIRERSLRGKEWMWVRCSWFTLLYTWG